MTERTIERVMDFQAPLERVWRAISDPEELSRWFGHRAELDLRPGGSGAMIWEEHGSFAVRVDEVDAPHRLVWSWVHEAGVAFDDAPATRVEWNLSPLEGGGTRLHLRESGFLTDVHQEQNREGWEEELAELKQLLDG